MKNKLMFNGIIFYIFHIIVSVTNDVIMKYLSFSLPFSQIVFMRVLLGSLFLIPIIIKENPKYLKTKRLPLHTIRGFLLFVSLSAWAYGLSKSHISVATTMDFTVPIFVLILAPIFLKEKVPIRLWITTLIGFFGILIALNIPSQNFDLNSFTFLISSFIFAILDIINKKYIIKEPILTMLFYSALIASLFTFIPAMIYWQTPTIHDILILFVLGIGGNLLLYFLLKALSLTKASILAPFRYLEFVISLLTGFLIFNETPTKANILGAMIILPCSLYIIFKNNNKI